MDPFDPFWVVQQQQQQMQSIYDQAVTWFVIALVVGIAAKFAPLFLWFRGTRRSSEYVPSPYGFLGPLFGMPAVRKSPEEIEADRRHAYKKWGSILSTSCFLGGVLLFVLGVQSNEGQDVSVADVITIKNAAPGSILMVFGFLIWRETHK
jgi:hypothetical protein